MDNKEPSEVFKYWPAKEKQFIPREPERIDRILGKVNQLSHKVTKKAKTKTIPG